MLRYMTRSIFSISHAVRQAGSWGGQRNRKLRTHVQHLRQVLEPHGWFLEQRWWDHWMGCPVSFDPYEGGSEQQQGRSRDKDKDVINSVSPCSKVKEDQERYDGESKC